MLTLRSNRLWQLWPRVLFTAPVWSMLVACPSQRAGEPVSSLVAPSNPLEQPAVPKESTVATLERLYSRVTLRRRDEGIWQEAAPQLPLFHLDAVQTHTASTARILFVSGSTIEMGESSLVIINGGTRTPGRTLDRAVIRTGKFEGNTKKELWILTSAALLRLRAKATSKSAKVVLNVEEGKKMAVTLIDGNASMVERNPKSKSPALQELEPRKTVTMAAPMPGDTFGFLDSEKSWDLPPERATASLPTQAKPAPKQPQAPQPIDLFITSPRDYAEVGVADIELKGRATGTGAKIFVNGKETTIENNLEFSSVVALREGVNSILIQLIRPDGESVFRRWTIIRE